MSKKLLASILVLVMILAMLPTAAFAEDGATTVSTEAELKAAIENAGVSTIKLGENINLESDGFTISHDLTIDLNGKTLEVTKEGGIWKYNQSDPVNSRFSIFDIRNANLTITGETGAIKAKAGDSYAIALCQGASSTCTIDVGNDVEIIGGDISTLYIGNNGGTFIIKGGKYSLCQSQGEPANPNRLMLNCKDANAQDGSAKFEISGGLFAGVDPAAVYSEPNSPTSFLAPGCVSKPTESAVTMTNVSNGTTSTVSGVYYEVKPIEIGVVPANLTGWAAGDGDNYKPAGDNATTYTAALNTDETAINVKAENLKKTENPSGVSAYWVGIGLTDISDAKYAFGFGAVPETIEADAYEAVTNKQTVGGQSYITHYWGAGSADDASFWETKKAGWVSVKVDNYVKTYPINFDVTVKKYNVTFAEGTDGTAGTGSFAEGETVTLVIVPDNDKLIEKVTVTPTGGEAFEATPSENPLIYSFTMPGADVEVSASYINPPDLSGVTVDTGETVIEGIPSDSASKAELEAALEAVEADIQGALGEDFESAVKGIYAVQVELSKAQTEDGSADYEVVVSTKVEYTNSDLSSETKTLTVDISLVAQVMKKAEEDGEDEQVGEDIPLMYGGAIEVTIGLPTSFGVSKDGTVFVTHNNGSVTEETVIELTGAGAEALAVLAEETPAALGVKFTSNDGLGTFVVTTNDPAVATIGDNSYATLEAAVEAAKANDTITLKKSVTLVDTLTVSKAIKIELEQGVEITGTIEAGSDYTMTRDDSGSYVFKKNSSGGYVPSGGGATGTSPVTVNKATNGKVSVNPQSAAENATVTITATPDEGYIVNTVAVVDKDGKYVTVTKTADGKYTFKMPKGGATVSVTFKKDDSADMKFTDVRTGDWFYNAVKYAYDNKLMDGTSATTFNPSGTVSRVQVAQVIYNMNGRPSAAGLANPFSDVKPGQWYTDAVLWCSSKGYMSGYGDGKFGANDNVTREQLALVFMNVMGGSGRGSLSGFTDADQVDSWALAGVEWAVANGIISGKGNNMLDPRGTAMRSELAQILMNAGAKVS